MHEIQLVEAGGKFLGPLVSGLAAVSRVLDAGKPQRPWLPAGGPDLFDDRVQHKLNFDDKD